MIAFAPPTMPRAPMPSAQNRTALLQTIQALRLQAGAETRAAFPSQLKRYTLPQLPASTISRARLAALSGPLFRAGLLLLALKVGGAPRERAQRVVDWLQSLVDAWWPAEEQSVRELAPREQLADGEEDRHQVEYHLGMPGARRRWLESLRTYRALAGATILALEAEEMRESRA